MMVADLEHYITCAIWRHLKTGKSYSIIAFSTREDDMMLLVTYRLVGDCSSPLWTRPASEFFDGRFVRSFAGMRALPVEVDIL